MLTHSVLQHLHSTLQYLTKIVELNSITVVCDDYSIQKQIQGKNVECLFAPSSLTKVMHEATNGTGFDLCIQYVASADESAGLREPIGVLGVLGTLIVVSDSENKTVAVNPPEATMLQTKRVTTVFGLSDAQTIVECQLYNGVILNMLEEIVAQYDKGTFTLLE